jgi:hypothetical protein
MATHATPNIVFVLCDNVGWGDFACYGGNTPTPRIDQLASEGIRFNNYTVEAQCTPSRSAILTGRQSVRSGTYKVPLPGEGKGGLVPWEYTIANLLSDAGYATSLWGKWHLGDTDGRLPTDQGFDEWWGYRNSADECGWTSYATFEAIAKAKGIQAPQIWASEKVPADRPMDGVDASEFLLGESDSTGRESLLLFGPDGSLMSVKWRNVKAILRYCEGIDKPILEPQFPMFFDLGSDPGERYNLFDRKLDMGWMFGVVLANVAEYKKSIAQYPNIEPGQEFNGYGAKVPVAPDDQ